MPHGHFPEFSTCPNLILHLMTFVFPIFTLRPFSSIPFFQVYKGHPQLLFLCQKLFLNLTNHKNSIRGTSPWSESKLHVINFYSIPHSSFYHSLKNLHHMIKQLYPSI